MAPQLAKVAAASGSISFLLCSGSFPPQIATEHGGSGGWELLCQLRQHLIPHIHVISHLLTVGRVDSVVGNRLLLTDRPFIVILSLPVHKTLAECREGHRLLLVGVTAQFPVGDG